MVSLATLALLVSWSPAVSSGVQEAPIRDAASLIVSPSKIVIEGSNRRQQILVTALTATDRRFDVTHLAEFEFINTDVARIDDAIVFGIVDGDTELLVRHSGLTARVSVEVSDISQYPPVNFQNDVIPLLSKLGCNSGGCHGKQSGQNGFKLSVFGFDARSDYDSLVREGRGRRVFPGDPARSLLLLKATGLKPHGGGQRTAPDSQEIELLNAWIEQGMPWGEEEAPRLENIQVEPTDRVLDMQSQQQIVVTAVYSDGSHRDVTSATTYTSNSDVVANVDAGGRVQTGTAPGEAAITVNYMGAVGAVRVIVPRSSMADQFFDPTVNNQIDALVWAKLKKLGVAPSELADDATYLRRVFLHAIGTLPSPDEVLTFLSDRSVDKRQGIVEAVLQREEYSEYWGLKFSDILMVNEKKLGARGAYEFDSWLRDQFRTNRPYDEWVRELITATGNSGKYGPVNFYRAMRTPEDLTKSISQAFLGIRMDCAQCHHHPFEKWGQADFYGMTGFFGGVQRKSLNSGRELIYYGSYSPAMMPLTGDVVETRPPGGIAPENLEAGDPRVHLAQWMTSSENPYFARLIVNRIWKHFLGRGLIEPEDDFRSTNPATNEPLLDFLADQLIRKEYDLKAVMRIIMNSRVYQLSSKPNDTNFEDEQNYSHFLVERIPAEVLLDSVSQVTSSPERFAGMPHGTRAIQLWDNRMPSYFLDTFGRSERLSACECGKSGEPTMAQALHLMNAPEIDDKISDPNGRVAGLVAAGLTQDEIVRELCLASLSRLPNEKEIQVASELFAQATPEQAAGDFLWSLLNSYDFLFVR
ncbi:MAG: DUF1553 domain-containing protein [Fuerstiella sp.]|nr:DUF1553 domain-containing protein [Fuerstiella sp.]